MNFGILCKHFGTVTQCLVDPTVPVLLTANFGLGENFQKKNRWPKSKPKPKVEKIWPLAKA